MARSTENVEARKALVVEFGVLIPLYAADPASVHIDAAREFVANVEEIAPKGSTVQVRDVRVSQ